MYFTLKTVQVILYIPNQFQNQTAFKCQDLTYFK